VHHKSIIYNKPTRCNSGSIVFIKNYKYALHQWLLLQFIVLLKMDTEGVRNTYSILVVVKHNTARVASCWFIIYYKGAIVSSYRKRQSDIATYYLTFWSRNFTFKF